MINQTSIIQCVPYEIYRNSKMTIVEHPQTGEYFEVNEIALRTIEKLSNDKSIVTVSDEIKEEFPEEAMIDVASFVEDLIDMNLVLSVDGLNIFSPQKSHRPENFKWVPPGIGKFFFNKFTIKLYLIMIGLNICLFIYKPSLFPIYNDVFLFDSMLLNVISLLFITIFLVLTHELGHILSIRAHDFPTNLEMSTRLFFIVFETDMTHAWRLDSKERNTLFLSGLYIDNLLLLIALLTQLLLPPGSFIIDLCAFIALDIIIRILYQFGVYMKTDLYFVLETITGVYNLMERGRCWLMGIRKSIRQLPISLPKEEPTVKWYACFYVIGVGLTFLLFTTYLLPTLVISLIKTYPNFQLGIYQPLFWDALLYWSQVFIYIILLLLMKRKASLTIK